METVVEKIHSEFNESFKKSDIQLRELIENLNNTDRTTSQFSKMTDLNDIGFGRSKTVEKATFITDQKTKLTHNLKALQDLQVKISNLRMRFDYKIISYGQIIAILEKYNLYISKSTNYIDIMPEENANQIIKYTNTLVKKSKKITYDLDIEDCLGKIDLNSQPICTQSIRQKWGSSDRLFDFYVCAPHEMFKKQYDRFTVGREIFYAPELKVKYKHLPTTVTLDPVVLHPLYIDNEIAHDLKLFHVVTAWGPEAKEPAIFNEKLN